MLTVLDSGAPSAHAVASLRAACDLLRAGSAGVSAVSVSGALPDHDGSALPIMSAAERLASEYGYAVTLRIEGLSFLVRFTTDTG